MNLAHETNFAAGVANAPNEFYAGTPFRFSTIPLQLMSSPEQRLVITWPQAPKEALSRNTLFTFRSSTSLSASSLSGTCRVLISWKTHSKAGSHTGSAAGAGDIDGWP